MLQPAIKTLSGSQVSPTKLTAMTRRAKECRRTDAGVLTGILSSPGEICMLVRFMDTQRSRRRRRGREERVKVGGFRRNGDPDSPSPLSSPSSPKKDTRRSLLIVHSPKRIDGSSAPLHIVLLKTDLSDWRGSEHSLSSPITCWWYPSIQLCDLEAACAPPALLAHGVPHCKKCPDAIC